MPVPETAMDEDHRMPARQHHVRFAGQAPVMKQIPEPKGMQATPHDQLGPGILALYTGHHAAARGNIDDISRQVPARLQMILLLPRLA